MQKLIIAYCLEKDEPDLLTCIIKSSAVAGNLKSLVAVSTTIYIPLAIDDASRLISSITLLTASFHTEDDDSIDRSFIVDVSSKI